MSMSEDLLVFGNMLALTAIPVLVVTIIRGIIDSRSAGYLFITFVTKLMILLVLVLVLGYVVLYIAATHQFPALIGL